MLPVHETRTARSADARSSFAPDATGRAPDPVNGLLWRLSTPAEREALRKQAPAREAPAREDEGPLRDVRGSAGFSLVSAWDSHQRVGYKQAASASRDAHLRAFHALPPDDVAGGRAIARDAFDVRQALRQDTQARLSPGGRLVSKAIEKDYTFEGQVKKYGPLLAKDGVEPTPARVHERVIIASGSSNKWVSGFSKFTRVAGPAGAVLGGLASGYTIANADPAQRGKVAAQEAGGFMGGLAGGVAGTALVGAALAGTAVAAPVVLGAAVVVGAAAAFAGSEGGRRVGEFLHDKLKFW